MVALGPFGRFVECVLINPQFVIKEAIVFLSFCKKNIYEIP